MALNVLGVILIVTLVLVGLFLWMHKRHTVSAGSKSSKPKKA